MCCLFHDTLGGYAIKEAYNDARYLHGEAVAIVDRNINFALQHICGCQIFDFKDYMSKLLVIFLYVTKSREQ